MTPEPKSVPGHSRPSRASSKSGHVRNAPSAKVVSEHQRLRDGLLRLDDTAVDMIQPRNWSLESCAANSNAPLREDFLFRPLE